MKSTKVQTLGTDVFMEALSTLGICSFVFTSVIYIEHDAISIEVFALLRISSLNGGISINAEGKKESCLLL